MQEFEQTSKLLRLFHARGFKPGDKLPSERELALLFNMSRSAIREALIRLDTLRIIDSRPKSGLYLRPFTAERSVEAMVLFAETDTPLSSEEVAQSVELRRILEIKAIRLACERRNQSDLDRMKAILDESERLVAAGESLAQADSDFHKAIVAATHNQVLLQFVNVFYLMSRKRREVYFSRPDQNRRSLAQHLQLYRAIVNRDADKGERLLGKHLQSVDSYFRMFFSDGKYQINGAGPDKPPMKPAAKPARARIASPVRARNRTARPG
jgi:GntR family transcriptional regulator, transcriptional repressor for pyruvate dehydrogenase complex